MVVLITGGTRGIGYGIARQLAQEGHELMLAGRKNETEVQNILDDLRKLTKVEYVQGNIGIDTERNRIIEETRRKFDSLNILINNAGMAPQKRKDLLEMTEKSYREVMEVNLMGPFFLTQRIAGWMIDQLRENRQFIGKIINISSISANIASVNRGEYCLSKAGMSMMTQLYAVKMAEYDIPVYEIRPGIIRTDMTAGVKDKYDHLINEGLTLQKRWGTPEDIGKAVSALVKGDFPYSTGQVFMVDGGLNVLRL